MASSHHCFIGSDQINLNIDGYVFPNNSGLISQEGTPVNECPKRSDELTNSDENRNEKRLDNWSTQETKFLISTYCELKHKFDSPQYKNSQVWDEISKQLIKQKIIKNPNKCSEKFRNLKKQYIKIKKHNNKSGNDKKNWIFWEVFNIFIYGLLYYIYLIHIILGNG